MFDTPSIIWILFFHWLADFVGQTSWMANNKSKSLLPLTTHILVYTTIVGLGFAGLMWFQAGEHYPTGVIQQQAILFAGVNGGLHFIIDFFTSKGSSHYFAKGNPGMAFKVIGFDQFLHTAILVYTYYEYSRPDLFVGGY